MIDNETLATDFARLFLRVTRTLDRRMAEQGASLSRTKLLMMMRRCGGTTRAADIAETFGHAPRTVTEAIDGLERDGLVRRDPDPEDRRAKRITITPAGERAVDATEPLRLRLIEEVFGVLDDTERAQFAAVIGKLTAATAALE